MKKHTAFLLLGLLFCLCACRKQQEAPNNGIVNWTLPSVSSFQEEYNASLEENDVQQQAETTAIQNTCWKPHGNYTYVTNSGGGYSTALFKISSVDYEKHCAVVTYTVKDSSGFEQAKSAGKSVNETDYFFESNGERVVGLDENTDGEGVRHVILYLSNEHYLEFTGREKLEKAKYCYLGHTYRLKYEG